jgi:hypothetical protein
VGQAEAGRGRECRLLRSVQGTTVSSTRIDSEDKSKRERNIVEFVFVTISFFIHKSFAITFVPSHLLSLIGKVKVMWASQTRSKISLR